MHLCRICLSPSADKDLDQLQFKDDGALKCCGEIFLFCLDIQVESDSDEKLCSSCFEMVLQFYEFKCLALRSDAYLREVESIEHDVNYTEGIKNKPQLNGKNVLAVMEEAVYWEDAFPDYNSGDEVIIIVNKEAEDDLVIDEVKETEPTKTKKGSKPNNVNKKLTQLQKKQKSIPFKEKCEKCGNNVKYLKSHMQIHQPHPEGKKYKCNKCDSTFLIRSERNDHYKIIHHRSKTRCQCDICGKYYKNQFYAEIHKKRVHFNIRPYKCALCPKTYHVKTRLNIHMRTGHTNEMPFQCSDCGTRFRCKDALRHHRARHDLSNDFTCQICDKTFKSRSNLYSHKAIHQEKRHECPECGSKFARATHVRRHLRAVHGALPEAAPNGRPPNGYTCPPNGYTCPPNGVTAAKDGGDKR